MASRHFIVFVTCFAILAPSASIAQAPAAKISRSESELCTIPDNGIMLSLRTSKDGRHFAYARLDDKKIASVVDGNVSAEYDDVDSVVFSPNAAHHCFRAKKGTKWSIVADSVEGPWFDLDLMPTYSSGGKHLIYAVQQDSKFHFVIDKVEGEVVDDAAPPVYSETGDHFGLRYVADKKYFLNIDGQKSGPYEMASDPTFSRSGSHVAYFVQSGNDWSVVVDGKKSGTYSKVSETLVSWSNDGLHYAFGAAQGDKWLMVVDGKDGEKVDSLIGNPSFGPGGHVAYTVQIGSDMHVCLDGKQIETVNNISAMKFLFLPGDRGLCYVKGSKEKGWTIVEGTKEYGPYQAVLDGGVEWIPAIKEVVYVAQEEGRYAVYSQGKRVSSTFEFAMDPGIYSDASAKAFAIPFNNGGHELSKSEIEERRKNGEYTFATEGMVSGGTDFLWIDGFEFTMPPNRNKVLSPAFESADTFYEVFLRDRHLIRASYKISEG